MSTANTETYGSIILDFNSGNGNAQKLADYILHGKDSGIVKALKQWSHHRLHGIWKLGSVLPHPRELGDADCRAIRVMLLANNEKQVAEWLANHLAEEKPDEDFFAIVREIAAAEKIAMSVLMEMMVGYSRRYVTDGRPNSLGRAIIDLPDKDLKAIIGQYWVSQNAGAVASLLGDHAPHRLEAASAIFFETCGRWGGLDAVVRGLLKHNAKKHAAALVKKIEEHGALPRLQYEAALELEKYDAKKFADFAFEKALATLAHNDHEFDHKALTKKLVADKGEAIVPYIANLMRKHKGSSFHWEDFPKATVLRALVDELGKAAIPAIVAAGEKSSLRTNKAVIELLFETDATGNAAEIRRLLRLFLTSGTDYLDIEFVPIARKLPAELADDGLWGAIEKGGKSVRHEAARALASRGELHVPAAIELLGSKKKDQRIAAVILLAATKSPDGEAALERAIDAESIEDVRDAIMDALVESRESDGRKATVAEIAVRIRRIEKKLETPIADWLDESTLPALTFTDAGAVEGNLVRYLCYRESRTKGVVSDPEAREVYALLEAKSAADFAAEIWRQYQATGMDDRWPLVLVGSLGDDRLVPALIKQVDAWANGSRVKFAEYAVGTLAKIGTDAALMAVNSFATKYQVKRRNVGAAATEAFEAAANRAGVSVDELADRVVPALGFPIGQPRILDVGGKDLEATVGLDFKIAYFDPEKKKKIKSLPKTADAALKAEIKEISAMIGEVKKSQIERLEVLMVQQHRWPADRWKEKFLGHPLMLPFAVRLVWAHYNERGKRVGTFRAMENRTLTTADSKIIEPPTSGFVGIAHPLELSDAVRAEWAGHLAGATIEPPFPQLERRVVAPAPDQLGQTILTAFDRTPEFDVRGFRSRAEKRGWQRGPVGDGGSIDCYFKVFPFAKFEVVVNTPMMHVTLDFSDGATIDGVFFVPAGMGKSPRAAVEFNHVPLLVYSEAIADLEALTGHSLASDENGDD